MNELLNTEEAALLLGYKPETLEVSRTRGELAGVSAPPFIKMGRAVRYRRSELMAWVEQFEVRTETEKSDGLPRNAI